MDGIKDKFFRQRIELDASRRSFFRAGAALGGFGLLARAGLGTAEAKTMDLPMVNGTRELANYPQKREMILMTARPVQLETPTARVQ